MVSVHVMFNGASETYEFDTNLVKFIQQWNNHIAAVGYFESMDTDGNVIIINPSNCGTIKIEEVKK